MRKYILFRLILLIFAFIHFLFTLKLDLNSINDIVLNNKFYLITKILSLFLLIFIYQLPIYIFDKIKNKDKKFIFSLKIFTVYFLILLTFFCVIFIDGGMYTVDEQYLLSEIKVYNFGVWAHWYHTITATFYAIILHIFRHESAICLTEIILVSSAFSFIFVKLKNIFKNKLFILAFITFILPFVLNAALCPARICLYSFILWFFVSLIFIKYLNKSEISVKNIIIAGLFSSVISMYRSEGFIHFILLPLGLFFIFKDKLNLKKSLLYIFILISTSFIIGVNQSIGLNIQRTYKWIPIFFELQRMFDNYDNLKIYDNDLQALKLIANPNNQNIMEFNAYKIDFNNFNEKKYLIIFIRLLKSNYKNFIKSRYELLSNSKLFHGDLSVEKNWESNDEASKKRKSVICKLEPTFLNCDKYNSNLYKKLTFIYNLPVVLLTLFLSFIFVIIFNKKDKFYLFLLLILLFHFMIMFLTSPVPYFDYYLPICITGIFYFLMIPAYLKEKICDKIKK